MIGGRALTALMTTALLCLGSGATTARPAVASLPAVGLCTADAELDIGATGTSVICLQFALGMLHMSSQPITGVFDQATADAVAWFQASNPPLRVDGRAGPRTLAALGIWSDTSRSGAAARPCLADATIGPGDASQSVVCLQDTLRELGLYDGISTGRSDLPTVAAVQQFQRDTPPLQVDGWAGPRTLAAMGIWSGNATGTAIGTSTVFVTPTPSTAPPGPWPAAPQDQPLWRVSAQGIPFYGNRIPCSLADANMIAYQFARHGADVPTQQWAVYIASRETNCNYASINVNLETQDDSHCAFQLNALAGLFAPTAVLGRLAWTPESVRTSMQACANAASDLWVYCGRGPWTPPYSCRPPWQDIAAAAVITGDGGGTD